MPKTTAAIATTLVLLTLFVSWQFLDLAFSRSVSTPGAQSQERLAKPDLPDLPVVLSEATIEPVEPAISPRTLLLERLSFEQFARYAVPPHGGAIVVVESGTLRVQIPAETSNSTDDPTFSHLMAGQSLTASANAPVTLANMELQPARVVLLTIPPFDPADERWAPSIPDPLPAGLTRETRVTGLTIEAQRGPLSLSMRLMQIAPGAAVAGHFVAESEMVLVESGSIEARIRSGEVLPLTDDTLAAGRSGTVVLSGGQGVAAFGGAEVTYRATGQSPATVIEVALALLR